MSADDLNHPVLEEAEVWAIAHRDLLKRTFERFEESGEWPQLEDLQHDFTVRGANDIDVATLARAMPRPLGFVEQGRLVLLTRGLSNVELAAGLLNVWAEALHVACQRWVQDHKTAWLTRKDVEELTHGDRHQTDLVSELLFRERWAFGDAHGKPTENWKQKIIDSVRIAQHKQDARMLLEKRAASEFPAPARQAAVSPEPKPEAPAEATTMPAKPNQQSTGEVEDPPLTPRKRLRRFFANPYAVVIIGGVVVLLIWAILAGGFHEVFDGESDGSAITTDTGTTGKQKTTGEEEQSGEGSKPFKETAGEGGASTYANPHTLSEPGEPVEPGQAVQVTCRVYSPEPPSVKPDGYWYRLASPPWDGQYYAPANSFWNGDIPGHPPYTHNTDRRVPECTSGHGAR